MLGLVALAWWGWSTRTTFPQSWDAVNFTLALERIDLVQHRPHPPGYLGFVAVGRALSFVTPDGHSALVLWNVFASVAVVGLCAALARRLAPTRSSHAAAWTALLIASSPSFSFYQRTAEIYPSELLFATLMCVVALCAARRVWLGASSGGLVLGLAGLFKPTTLVLLTPLAITTSFKLPTRWRLTAAAGFLAALALWVWSVLLVVDPAIYWRGLVNQGSTSTAHTAAWSGDAEALGKNARDTLRYLLLTFGLAPALLCLRGARREAVTRLEWRVGLSLVAPFLLVALFVHIPKPGYLLPLLAPGMLAFGVIAAHAGRAGTGLAAAAVVANALMFWLGVPPGSGWTGGSVPYKEKSWSQRLGTESLFLFEWNARKLRDSDTDAEATRRAVRSACPTSAAVVVIEGSARLDWRRAMFLLPDDQVVARSDEGFLVGSGGQTTAVGAGHQLHLETTCRILLVSGSTADGAERGRPVVASAPTDLVQLSSASSELLIRRVP